MNGVSWGVRALDALTQGKGIYPSLYLLYSDAGAGKTTLTSYVPIARIAKQLTDVLGKLPDNARFIVMDGDGGFDLDRARQVWELNGLDPDEVEKRLLSVVFTTFAEQHDFICGRRRKGEEEEEAGAERTEEMEEVVKRVIDAGGLEAYLEKNDLRPLLVTLDPAVAIYRQMLLRTPAERRGLFLQEYGGKLDLQLSRLRRLSVVFNIPAFVTSWTKSPLAEAMKKMSERRGEPVVEYPVPFIGGRSFDFLPKHIWEIRMPREAVPERVLWVYKSKICRKGTTAMFRLCDAGIEEIR